MGYSPWRCRNSKTTTKQHQRNVRLGGHSEMGGDKHRCASSVGQQDIHLAHFEPKWSKCLLFSLEKTAVRENEEMILKESQGPRDTEISVCQGFSKTTLKLLCSQTQLWCSTGKGSQLNSAKGKMHGAETRRDQVHAPKWCLQWSCMEPWNSPSNAT